MQPKTQPLFLDCTGLFFYGFSASRFCFFLHEFFSYGFFRHGLFFYCLSFYLCEFFIVWAFLLALFLRHDFFSACFFCMVFFEELHGLIFLSGKSAGAARCARQPFESGSSGRQVPDKFSLPCRRKNSKIFQKSLFIVILHILHHVLLCIFTNRTDDIL